jgi:hypothetical protein
MNVPREEGAGMRGDVGTTWPSIGARARTYDEGLKCAVITAGGPRQTPEGS